MTANPPRPTALAPPALRVLGLLPLSLLLALSLFSIGFWILTPLGVPTAEDYELVERSIRAGWRDGDAVAQRPWWAARIRQYVGDLPFVQVRDLATEDLSRFARLWVVALPGYGERRGGLFADGRVTLELEQPAGRLLLRRYRLPPAARVLYDFRERLKDARVRMFSGSAFSSCASWVENRWVCTPRDWNYVGRMIVELGDDPREIIWAHPSDTGPIEITYENVPGGRTLLVHTGFTPPGARVREGVLVTLTVLIDGQELRQIVQHNLTGYFPTTIDIAAFGPGPHVVTFRVSCPNIGMRHFCFDGEVRG